MLCERCGSIDIARSRSSRFDVVVRFFTGSKRYTCRRCGWSARRDWTEADRPDWTQPARDKDEQIEFDIDRFD